MIYGMKNAILLHGKPPEGKFYNPELLNPADSNWLPWVDRRLTLAGYRTARPNLPKPYDPDYDRWARELRRYDLTDRTTIIGHSAGAALAGKWLSQHPAVTIDKLVMVAPWTDPNNKYHGFFDVELDPNLTERCLGGITVFHSSDDDGQALASLEVVRTAFGDSAKYIDIPAYGHFMIGNAMDGPEFQELVDEVL